MKSMDIDTLDQRAGVRIGDDDTFCFGCHSQLACFNRCCRNLNLFLYPYDVLRLKNNLKMSSDAFLDAHTDIVLRKGNFFPDVLLRMAPNEDKTCPFVTPRGCSVYPDRPDSCRMFPLEQGLVLNSETTKPRLLHFFRPPDFCLGQRDHRQWTPRTWARDQDTERHNRMTARWAEIKALFGTDPWGDDGPHGSKAKMAFMATYNIDRFRDFIFESSFLKRYRIKPVDLKKIKRDETELLKLGFEWVAYFVWGRPAKRFRAR